MANSVMKSTFTAGEVSPGLYSRVDLTKYAAGAATLKNWYVDPAGGISNRPGTAYVGRTKQGSNLGNSTPVSSQKGTITYWFNPIGGRANEAGGDGTDNFICCQANAASQTIDGYIRGWSISFQTKKVGDVFVPDKFAVVFDFEDLFCADGTYVQKYIVEAGTFATGAGYVDLPADGFPLMFIYDFSGSTWSAQIWMGKADGTVAQIDNAYSWKYFVGGPSGSPVTGTTATMTAGSPLDPTSTLFDGANRVFYFNFGTTFDVDTVIPPPDPLPNTQLWHTIEYSQPWFGPDQLLTPSTAMGDFYDSTSTPKWAPKNLGTSGATPTGTAALWYFNGDTTTAFNASAGTDGIDMATYCVTSGLDGGVCVPATAASTIPLSGSYQGVGIRFGINNGSGVALNGLPSGSVNSCLLTGIAPPRLIPFTFSTVQTYMLEFGTEYMRVVKDGGYVLETASTIQSISNASPGILTTTTTNSFTNSDWVFVQGASGMTEVNGRVFMVESASTDSFALTDVDNNGISTVAYGVYTTGGTVARIYTLATPYQGPDLATLKYTQSADVLTICHPNYPPKDLTRTGDASWTLTSITFSPDINPPTTVSAVASAGGGFTYRYQVTAINSDGTEESRASTSAVVTSAQMSQVTGAHIKVSFTPVAGASAYNIYRQPEVSTIPDLGMLYGFCGSTTGVNFTDQNILPDFSRTPPQARNPFANSPIQYIVVNNGGSGFTTGTVATVSDSTGSGWTGFLEVASGALVAVITQYGGQDYTAPTISFSGGATATCSFVLGPATGNYPSCVTYFQQRKVFAGSLNAPETMWFTQIGNFRNMDVSVPTRDSDAITVTLASLQVNIIEWMVPMTSGLIIGTRSGAWQVSGGQFLEPITPTQIVAQPQAFNGASYVQPLPVNYDILYIQNLQDIVRDLSYNFYVNIYTGADLTVISKHLFAGFQLLDWCYQDEPFKLVWGVRNDGELLSMTYLKEQEEWGWTHHDTQGSWRRVGTIVEGEENVLYLIAERTIPGINGGNPVYYLERMASRNMNTAWNNYDADVTVAWFLDCAAQYPLITPDACLDFSPGLAVASTDSFVSTADGDTSVGDIIRIGGGVLTVTTVSSSTVAFTNTLVDPTGGMHATTGAWTLTKPVITVTGLWHLEGATVYALSNGSVEGPFVVVNGQITLTVASDIVTVGLLIEDVRAKTLYLDVGNPTIQGKRKTIPGVTLRMWNSRELMIGPPGGPYAPQKLRTNEPLGQPTRLVTGDVRTNIQSQWRVEGQVEWFMPYPLPATVTGVIDEVSVGDTGG